MPTSATWARPTVLQGLTVSGDSFVATARSSRALQLALRANGMEALDIMNHFVRALTPT